MANKPNRKTPNHNIKKPSTNKTQTPVKNAIKHDLLSISDGFFEKHKRKIFWICIVLTCIFGALLFDLKISEGTDDSGYIVAAHDFIKGKSFPTWHGSFYPIFLSLPMLIFGMSLFAFKFASYLLMIGHFIFLYKAFRNRLSATILCFVMLLTSINSYILYHASSTYSEPLFFFLQSLTLYFFLNLIDTFETQPYTPLKYWKLWLGFGACCFLLSITRNVGIGILISIIVYFIINKQFKGILYSVGAFLIFQIPYSLYKSFYWHLKDAGFKSQMAEMYYKDPYNHAFGTENINGFITRFFGNSELYLSKHFCKIIGLQSSASTDKSSLIAVIVYLLFVVSFIIALRKKNKYIQFIALYLAVAIGATFVTQQVFWDQVRLILIYVPLIIILLSYGIYEISKSRKFKLLQSAFLLFFIVILFASFSQTNDKIKSNKPILDKNLEGNLYYGFTPDWIHYFQISEWAAQNLPKEAGIACRKPSMSFIYSKGREFNGYYKLPMISIDSAMSNLIKRKADIIIIDNSEMETKKFPANLFDSCRRFNRYMIISKSHFYTVYEPLPDKKAQLLASFKQYNLTIRTDAVILWKEMKDSKEDFYVEDADYLIKTLKDSNSKFIILASLRAQPAEKNGNIIDTMQRLVYFIQIKYPNMFKIIHQIGAENDEPAELLEIVD